MKKYLFIFGLVGTALFTACSSADDLVADIPSQGLTEEEKAMIVEAGQDSDVPITIGSVGSNRAITRKPIDSGTGDLFEITGTDGQYLGVFCLAQGVQAGAPDIDAIPDTDADVKWNGTCQHANWMENIPAKVLKHNASSDSPIDGGYSVDYSYVQFMKDDLSGTKVYYYPFGNWYYYDFFAYYPRQASVSTIAKSSSVDFTITGKEDIIWAHAAGGATVTDPVTSNSVKSYSAKYMRLSKEDLDGNGSPDHTEFEVVPGLAFEHKLTQFVFSIKPHDTDAAQLFAKGFALTGMSLQNVYHKLRLIVASKAEETGNVAGTLSIFDTSASTGLADIQVSNPTDDSDPFGGGSTTIPVANTAGDTSTKLVGYALVPSSDLIADKAHNAYMVSISLSQTSGDPVPDTVIPLTPPAGGFLAGHKYNITLEIYSPTNIQATATLTGWTNVAETVIGVD